MKNGELHANQALMMGSQMGISKNQLIVEPCGYVPRNQPLDRPDAPHY